MSGGTHALLDDVLALPDHGDNGSARGDVLDERGVEGAAREVLVVLLGEALRGDERLDASGQCRTSESVLTQQACSHGLTLALLHKQPPTLELGDNLPR